MKSEKKRKFVNSLDLSMTHKTPANRKDYRNSTVVITKLKVVVFI